MILPTVKPLNALAPSWVQVPPASVDRPRRTWAEELRDAEATADRWLAQRQGEPRLYVELDDAQVDALRVSQPELARTTLDAATEHRPPKEIIAELRALEKEIDKGLAALEEML